MEITKRTARVLIRREFASDKTPWYVAQVLEHDLATQVKNISDIDREIERIVVAHITCCEENGIEPFDSLPAAPKPYFAEYDASTFELTRSIGITRGKTEQARVSKMPDLVYRFALGA